MSENRVQFSTIVSNQLPAYVREDFPLVESFLESYYRGQEYQGGPVDLIQNIDRYIKVDNTTNLSSEIILEGDIEFDDTTINVSTSKSPTGTDGFPDSYGLIQIDDEIITYTGKTSFSFTGCKRGFVGITSYRSELSWEEVIFKTSSAEDHDSGSTIKNLSVLFLKDFLVKTKHQILPGFEERSLNPDLNQKLFLKQSKDFYLTKGTDRSFEILFKALYNEDVQVIKPRDNLVTPSNANFRVLNEMVVEPISGNPLELENATLYQDQYDDIIEKAYAPISSVEKVDVGFGKTFYRLTFDGGYNRDIGVDGSAYGEFQVEPTTKIIGQVSAGATVFDVDSTVGFSTDGELHVVYSDTTTGVVSYTSKSLTQFFGVSNVSKTITDASTVGVNTFAYASTFDGSDVIKVRVNSVINSIDNPSNSKGLKKGETINISSLGISENNKKTNNWIYNLAPIYKVKSIDLIDSSNFTYEITLNVENIFNGGDSASLVLSDGTKLPTSIIDVKTEKSFTIRGQGQLDTNLTFKIQRNISKTKSNFFPTANIYSTNIQNVYKSVSGDDYLVASPSIPSYKGQPLLTNSREIKFSGTFNGTEFIISPGKDHGLYTGDKVYYAAERVSETYIDEFGNSATRLVRGTGLFADGEYYVERVNSFTIKFAKSKSNIYNSKYVSVDTSTSVRNSIVIPFEFYSKNLKPQNLLRKISKPLNDGSINQTKPGTTGILINGVEISNYKSTQEIKYGSIEEIEVTSPGSDLDIVNPPELLISDSVGTGATGYLAISGSLQEILIKNSGFDYLNTPTIKIDGGNGKGAVASVNMKLIDHEPEFFADNAKDQVVIGTASTQSRIGFSTYHKFKNAEEVIYITNNQDGIAGIVTNAQYYVSTIDDVTVSLHPKQNDAILGINTVFLTDFGVGKHSLKSVSKKSVVDSINVVNGGLGYQNKKRTTSATSGVSTASNTITISNHDYNSGELVRYTCVGTPVNGLNVDTDYYVTKENDNSFKLSQVGVTSDKEFYYRTKQYVNLTSVGVGTHVFNYPDITVTLKGEVGISSIGLETFEASITPVFRGSVTSVHLENNGVGYGSSEILNLDHQPQVTINSGSNCQLKPIIENGRIVQVIVQNSGSGYNSPPDVDVIGDGVGAVITLNIVNGSVTSVNIIEKGAGYLEDTTSITITPSGNSNPPKFKSNLKTWRVNLFEKYLQYFESDDGFIVDSRVTQNELQYTHLYAPRKLRENIFAVDQNGNKLYGESDLRQVNGIEQSSTKHSPIIGFAYDGNPIYGPYGYSSKSGGTITQIKSGYKIDIKSNRPPTSIFPEGFFVEDYSHFEVSDDDVLDANNGRFCITPEYPNGTYAYFTTINSDSDNSGVFEKYKKPVFPYLIGDNYQSIPDDYNFKNTSLQEALDSDRWRRNTHPYNIIEDNLEYSYIDVPNKLKQSAKINSVQPGTVNLIGISSAGVDYRIGDQIVFDNSDTRGDGLSAKVSHLKGRTVNSVSVATSTLSNVEIYSSDVNGEYVVYNDKPHNFLNFNVVTIAGLSTTSSKIEGTYRAGITTNRLSIVGTGTTGVAIGTVGVTGLVTFFGVSGDLSFSKIRDNDILMVGEEKVQVLNVDAKSSRIRVLREVEGTTGTSHTIGKYIFEDPRKIIINAGFKTDYNFRINKQIYFNPEVIGLGTISGVGIGTTISFSNPGSGITSIFIPTKTIFIENHNLKTGDEVTYSPGTGGSGIIVEDSTNVGVGITLTDGQKVFVAKIDDNLIGIATVRVGLGTTGTFVGIASTHRSATTLFFRSVGSGTTHSFKTNYSVLTGEVRRNLVTVSAASTHGLSSPHNISISVSPNNTITKTLKYNDFNRRVIVDPVGFATVGVNTTNNTISVASHGFVTGDKIIHTSTVPTEGLDDQKIYYIVKVDNNTIKLANTKHDATIEKPNVVGLSSASLGTINPINPSLKVYKNSTVEFDLSDSSLGYTVQGAQYPAFEFNLYTDKNFTKIFNKSDNNNIFELTKTGNVGSAGAKATLTVNENLPDVLYYKLDVIRESSTPTSKIDIIVDGEANSNNEINCRYSEYNGTYSINVGTTTSFTYTLGETPESTSYTSSSSTIEYETDCTHTYGPIAKVSIENPGKNYYSLPGITTVTTSAGKNAILFTSSKDIGKVKNIDINNIDNYKLPSDKTLSPTARYPQILKIDRLAQIESIGISSFGRGYQIAPKLIVIDGKTNKFVNDIDLKFKLANNSIEILKNTNGISNATPKIIPTQTDSGVGINTITYDSSNGNVDVTLSVGFSTINSFPFKVGDKVLVENVSVGVGSTGKGFDSANYNYKLFTLTAVTENLGGIGSVRYNISDSLTGSEFPGTFDTFNSSGRITAEKNFAIFDIKLQTKNYIKGETVSSGSKVGIVEDWDSKIDTLTISSDDIFDISDVIKGKTSNISGIATSVESYDTNTDINSSVKTVKGRQSDSGLLNFDMQRIQDSLYYQNFSYSLKSRIDFDTWNDSVSATNHTLGFKKFADYQLESNSDNSMVVGVSTDLTNVTLIKDVDSFVSLNCVFDFDLVKENNFNLNNKLVSDEIIFSNRILSDYFESVGNRVLSIDDLSSQFNSNPRPTAFSVINSFNVNEIRSQKYITLVRDKRFAAQRQLLLVDLIHDGSRGYLNQYARVESQYDQGSFDFAINSGQGELRFFPTKFKINDYNITALSYGLDDVFAGVGTTSLGGVALIESTSSPVTTGVTTNIVSIANTYTSAKVLVQINPDTSSNKEFETIELNIVHDGSNVELLDYGRLSTSLGEYSDVGLGTYHAYISGSNLKVDFIPTSTGIGTTGVINTIQVGLASDTFTGIGTADLKNSRIKSETTSISSSATPGINTISQFDDNFDGGYFLIQVVDTTNNNYQLSEIILLDDYTNSTNDRDTYMTEYGVIESSTTSGFGTFGARVSAAGTVSLVYTPIASVNTVVNVYSNNLCLIEDEDKSEEIDFTNGSINSSLGAYQGTESDIKREFELKHENLQVFERYFEGDDSSIVSVANNTIKIPNHFFVSGEKIRYVHVGNTDSAVGVATTSFVGASSTTFLPGENLYAVKVDDNNIKIASSAENALKPIPQIVELESVGIGTSHRFIATNQNAKVIVAIDNVIQSPVVSTAVTTTLAESITAADNILKFSGITSFFGSDLIRIGNEIMKIEGIGIADTNSIRVRRPWLGTKLSGFSTGAVITKVVGNYNIVDNHLSFVEAPFGNTPIGSTTNAPDERDWTGITTSSSFQGRSFIRSGIQNSSNEAYHKNYIFDDISQGFNGTQNEFRLYQNSTDVTGISTENAIILVNDVFQTPGSNNQYTLNESAGITSVTFNGTETDPLGSDVGISSFPKGGIIVSVGSTEGLGYQPLVAAGGTAVVSGLGTIQSISIGNSGSGYRSGIQTVNVGVGLSATGTPSIEFVGTAVISNGNVVSVAITNPGTGYTTSNIPYVVFDQPLSYSNLSLEYSSSSVSGVGTEAKIDIVVGQGSSVIDFEITNTGYGFGNGEILTVAIGGTTGIPTTSSYSGNEFQITIDEIATDEFTGWSLGTLQVLDDVSGSINGIRRNFNLLHNGTSVSIVAAKGSKINVQDVLLIFVNNILQVPGEGYTFDGGNFVTFTEAPKVGDTVKILFYKGSGDTDVIFREVIETVKKGDTLQIKHDSATQDSFLTEDERSVTLINSTSSVQTNPYYGPGNTSNVDLERPVTWCRQTEDKIIDEIPVGKDRELYEPVINPSAYIIKSVGVGSTAVYVDSLRPLFNSQNEAIDLTFQNKIKFIRQEAKTSAAATAVVSGLGTISSIVISDGGVGYTTATVSIASTVGVATTSSAFGSVTISAGTVTGVAITSPGVGYTNTNPPAVLISPPAYTEEEVSVTSFSGDLGIIVGFGTTNVGVGTTSLIFDLHIPYDSFLRDTNITGTAVTISSLDVNDLFIVRNSNIGAGETSITSFDSAGNTVGVGTSFADNVYAIRTAVSISTSVQGITTHVRRVTVDVDKYITSGITTSEFFGDYSFGKVEVLRTKENSYTAYTTSGVGITEGTGISTSPMIVRSKSLKFKNYSV